jgi:hypothetical protein
MTAPLYFTATMTSGQTMSRAVDLGYPYGKCSIEIPTMISGTDVYLKGSSDGTTYRRIYFRTEDATPVLFTLASSLTNAIFPLDVQLPRYVKVELSTAISNDSMAFGLYVYN